jgi:hypothetical protein
VRTWFQAFAFKRNLYRYASVLVSVAQEHYFGDGTRWARGEVNFFKEWQAPACGALFCVMGAGNFRATVQTWLTKRKFAKTKKA